MKTSFLALAIGVALAYPAAAYADGIPNIFEGLFQASDHTHRARDERVDSAWHDPFTPRRTDGLSSNRNACASYGCVGAGGGGD
jgi:hypothetical protein